MSCRSRALLPTDAYGHGCYSSPVLVKAFLPPFLYSILVGVFMTSTLNARNLTQIDIFEVDNVPHFLGSSE